MTIDAVRERMSQIDVLYDKLDKLDSLYTSKKITYVDYMTQQTILKSKIHKLFEI